MAVIVIVFLISCEKGSKENTEKKCPVVAANLVPQMVKDSFVQRYPVDSVRTWFNKDNVGYCAYFVSFGIEKLARFSNNGNFIKEENESNENNEHEDSTVVSNGKLNSGCECEVHQKGD